MKATSMPFAHAAKKLLLTLVCMSCLPLLHAQVTGTKTIGVDYPDLASAITDLNTNGISGSVTINVPAGYTETAPAGGYLLGSATLNASTSATGTLTIHKTGAGADPLLTAPAGASTTTDGIFIIQGTDYVTIDGIDLSESPANTTPTTWMEWGYALVKLSGTAPFDGCNNVTIQNCTITLNRSNTPTVGIYANNHTATSTTALTISDPADAMSNCRFYGNTIANSVTGIMLKGFAAPSPYSLYDQSNDVGGSSAATGNTIQNFAGTTTGMGINLQYQNGANVSFNNIDNTAGGGVSATSIVYGIYTQNGTNASVTESNNTIHLTQGTTFSAMYGINTSCSGTGTVNVNDNVITANGGSSGTMYMIYMGGANANVTTNNNHFSNINVATSGSLYMIYHSTAATPANITCNNNIIDGAAIPYLTKTGSGGTVAGYYNNAGSGSGTTTLNNNNFSNISLTGSPTFYGIFENDGGTGQSKSARNNIISNVTSTTGGTQYGISMGYSASAVYTNNTVFGLSPGSGAAYGLYISFSSTVDSMYNNRVSDLTSTGGNVYGIYIASGANVNIFQDTVYTISTGGTSNFAYGIYESSGTTVNIFRNRIYDIASNGTSGSAYGMYLNSGTVTAYNNLIGDIRTPASGTGTGTQLAGIYVNGGTAHNIYYNTVYLNASSTGANFGSAAIYTSTTPAVTLRNNIFVNLSAPSGTGIVAAYRRNGTSLTSYQAASNNNLFYAGVPGASHAIFYDGTSTYTNLSDFTTLVSPRDANSVTENPPFTSTTGSSSAFLHISTTTPTQVESGAANIAGITTDYDGTVRQGNPGYTGSGTAPDIGAAEGNYILTDRSAPNTTYTVLSGACSTGDRTFTVNITDATGVPVSGTLVPRVYFRKGSGSWFSAPGSLASGTATSGTWSFTISAATMGGLAVGDVVSYFIIAQDVVTPANIGADPGTGLVATDVNTISTFPTSPNSYTVLPVLSGTYNVGSGGAYTTLTAAVNDYNTSCVSGNVVFQLTDASYPSETFPITINDNASANIANRLTIRPAAGVSPVITGSSSTAIMVLNGADYVTLDGSNASVPNSICPPASASRDMTITNTSTSTSSAVVWIQSATTSDSATHNTIRNCNVAGAGSSVTLFAIGLGGTTISYTSSGTNNNSNRIENNNITATQTGIFSRGASATNKNTGNVITQNLLNSAAPDNLRNNGIMVNYEDGVAITGNQIANISNASSADITGIDLGFGNSSMSTSSTTGSEVTNAVVTNNNLNNLTQTNTYSCVGIAVAGAASGITVIANNMISGVISNGTGGDFSSGIFIGGATGGATHVYYNAVDMSGTVTGASYPSFAIAVSGSNPVVELKNNIFTNHASTGSSHIYAIGLAYTTYSNLSSDHNDFFSIGMDMGVVGSLTGGGTGQPTLAAWQATTGNDANSKDAEPAFASASDLHLTSATANIPLMDAGVPVPVTTDFDCNIRSTTPDIGINEFSIPICGPVTAGTALPAISAFCNSGSTTITITGASVGIGINYTWESSADSTSWSAIPGATSATYTTPTITATTYYRVVLRCIYSGATDSAATKVTIYPLPVITVSPDGGGICSSGSGLSMTASGASTYSWSPATGLSTAAGPTVVANPPATTTYTVTGTDVHGCASSDTSTVTVTSAPAAFTVTPPSAAICASAAPVLLTAGGAALPSTGPDSATSGAISLTVPDATAGGASTSLTIPGVPPGATITDVSVKFNLTMTYDGDLTINLTAPNGNTINMVNRRGGSGDNFVNTVVSSSGGTSFASSSAPFTGTYSADAATGAGSTSLPVTTTNWADLFSAASGTWTLSARDWAGGDIASITSWTITVNYTYEPSVTWTPLTGLFTDAAGTVPYTGDTATTVYAKPADSTIYIATLTVGACNSTTSVPVNIIPIPTAGLITGPAGVCTGGTATLTDSIPGGVWFAGNPFATVSTTGLVHGITPGTDTIYYAVTNACGSDTTGRPINIEVTPAAGTVSGASAVCEGATISLTDLAPGGVWTVSNAHASVSSPGIVTGVSAGTVTVSYTIANSCGTAVASHAVTVNPSPHADSITGPGSVCEGATIIVAVGAHGGTWSSNGHVTVSPLGVVSGIHAGLDTVKYSVTNSCGTDVAMHPVTVNPAPHAGAITGPSAVCIGDSIALADTAAGGIFFATSIHASVSRAGVVRGISAGVVNVDYQVTNGCGADVAVHPVTVNISPTAGTITGPANVCTGNTIVLSDAVPGGAWSTHDPVVTVDAVTGAVTGVAAGTAILTYTVVNACGSARAVFPVSVFTSPDTFRVTGGGAYCAGGTGVHVGLAGSQTGMTYQLFNGGTTVGLPVAGTGGAIDFGLVTGAGTYTVLATSGFTGCTLLMPGHAIVTVNSTLPPHVSISAPTFVICTGSSITMTAIPVNGGPAPAYQWQVNGVYIATGDTFTYTPATGDIVKVTITSTPCAMPDTASATVPIVVAPYTTPSVTVTASPSSTVCAGTSVTFTAHPTGGGASPAYRWTKNGINVATGATYTYIPANGDDVYCEMFSNSPCRIGDSAESNHIIMHVSTPAAASVTITGHPGTVISDGQPDTLTANVVNGGPSPTYQWYVNSVVVPGATGAVYISHTFHSGDVVTVVVTTSGPCGGATVHDAITMIVTATSVTEVSSGKADIKLLPNPNNGTFILKGTTGTATDEGVNVEVTDMTGRIIYKGTLAAKKGVIDERMNLGNNLANGMYMLNLYAGEDKTTFHFVLER